MIRCEHLIDDPVLEHLERSRGAHEHEVDLTVGLVGRKRQR